MPLKVIAEQDSVILKKDTNYKVFKIIKNRNVTFCKEKFCLDNLVGQTYGSRFIVVKGQLVKLSQKELLAQTDKPKAEDDEEVDGNGVNSDEGGRDNRSLIDKRDNQKLTKEEITQLRKDGATGNEIVDRLIENSSTFSKKTEYSKEKYIKKKTQKHVNVFTLLESNTRNLLSMYYFKGPTKICNLRMDSLAQILTYANVHSGGKYLVVDNCSGLVLGSMIERLNGQGIIVNVYTGSAPSKPAVDLGYNLTDEQKQVLHEYPLDRIAALDVNNQQDGMEISGDHGKANGCDDDDNDEDHDNEGIDQVEEDCHDDGADLKKHCSKKRKHLDKEERDRRREAKHQRITKSRDVLNLRDLDGLIICTKFHPTPIVVSLMKFLRPSRPIVVFCPFSEPLKDCYSHLRDRGDVLMLKLQENWLRSYQILPERSHPHVNMSGSGGFLLTGLAVQNE